MIQLLKCRTVMKNQNEYINRYLRSQGQKFWLEILAVVCTQYKSNIFFRKATIYVVFVQGFYFYKQSTIKSFGLTGRAHNEHLRDFIKIR